MAQTVIINGVTYQNVASVQIPKGGSGASGNAIFYETSDADVNGGSLKNKVLSGYKAYGTDGGFYGTMTNVGKQDIELSSLSGVTISEGYHNGTGTARISATEQNKIVAGNIKSGVTILGVSGSSVVVDTTVASANVPTASDIMSGKKAFANGTEITGSASVPTVSQNASTKVLTIQ